VCQHIVDWIMEILMDKEEATQLLVQIQSEVDDIEEISFILKF